MRQTSPQHYFAEGQTIDVDQEVLQNAVLTMQRIAAVNAHLFPLLTLNHLSIESDVPYGYLRKIVARERYSYRHITLRKSVPGRTKSRLISIPDHDLLQCQTWISEHILKVVRPHPGSYAYHPGSNPVFAARVHTRSNWLIKVDIHDFFHAISEHRVYKVFRSLGYSALLSFELARICTMPIPNTNVVGGYQGPDRSTIRHYDSPFLGVLPQGAPTSPMISNLAMRGVDEALAALSTRSKMRFTRYADDIVFSSSFDLTRHEVNSTKRKILKILNNAGFRPNNRKTVVRGPGTRKIVLGILVDGNSPRLPKEFKDKLRQHLYYLMHANHGPRSHAASRNTSISRIYHHVFGLICWAKAVEPTFGEQAMQKFNCVDWPPISKPQYYY